MKKSVISLLLLIIAIPVFSADYDSCEMLSKYYNVEPLEEGSAEYEKWENTKVSLITVSKDDPVYSWFGHTALLFEYPDMAVVFDYGNFSFGEDFYVNFALGRLWYKCCGSYADLEMAYLEENCRTVSKVELDISPEKKKALDGFLWTNISQEHNTYLYHNYKDNCATRVRDILNILSDGDFEKWASEKEGVSYRKQISTIMCNSPLLQWLFDLIQGHEVDMPCTAWDEMFLPKNLEKYLCEYGKMGSEVEYPVDFRGKTSRKEDSSNPESGVLTGIIAGAALLLIAFLTHKTGKNGLYRAFTFSVDLITGLAGVLMVFMSFFTLHDYCYNNENLLFVNPLVLVCAVLAFAKKKPLVRIRSFIRYILLASISVLVILKIVLPEVFFQCNLAQIITYLPYYLFVAVCCKRDYNT